jgi:tRNA A64-2'-O-ribosylphosphate transferase
VIDERTPGYHRIICCTSSRRESDPVDAEDGAYIQGAGDDSEGWISGASLTPQLFWDFKEVLQKMDDVEIAEFTKSRTLSASSTTGMEFPNSISPGDQVFISTLDGVGFLRQAECFSGIITCSEAHIGNTDAANEKAPVLQLKCGTGKLGSRALRKELLLVQPFIDQILKFGPKTPKILVACASGRDLSVGVALAILCMNCRDDGNGSRSPFTQFAVLATNMLSI